MNSAIAPNTSISYAQTTPRHLPWLVCFCAALFFLFEFLQVNIFNAITPSLMDEFAISAARIGQICANYFYASFLFVLPAGMILDRVSTRKVILIAMTSSVLSTYLFSCVTSPWAADVCRFVTGMGGSFCFISCIRLASRWFPARRLALIIGLMVTMAMFGGMLAQTPMTLLTDILGWRNMLIIDAMLGIIIIGLIFFFVHDQPTHSTHINSEPILSWRQFLKALTQSLLNLQNWLGGFYTSLLNLPLMLMGALWGSLYLVQVHGLTRTQSSFVTSMIFIGTILGSPLIGWLSDKIGRRQPPMILCALLSLAVILSIMLVPSLSISSLIILFFALGLFTSGQILSYPLIAESNPKALTGTSEGIASTLIMAGGISQPIFGFLMGLTWDHKMINNIPFYSHHDFLIAMSIMPITLIIGLIAAIFIKETHCKPLD